MSLIFDDELTVEGYRDAVDAVLKTPVHAKEIARLISEFNDLRPVQVKAAYLLGQGESLRNVAIYSNSTEFLIKQWLAFKSFKLLITSLAPQYTDTIEGFTFDTKDQHSAYLNEMIKRGTITIETCAYEGQEDPVLAQGFMCIRRKAVAGGIETEYVVNPALKEIRAFLQMRGELEGIYNAKPTDNDDGETIESVKVMDLLSDDPTPDGK